MDDAAGAFIPRRPEGPCRLGSVAATVLAQLLEPSPNGVDRWLGGVHLTGRAVPWRWDDGMESIVPVER